MIKVFEYPFIRLLLPFCAGIFLALFNPIFNSVLILWVSISLLFVLIGSKLINFSVSIQKVQGIIFQIILFSIGYQLTFYHDIKKRGDFFYPLKQKFLQVEITKELTEKQNTWRTEGKIIAVGEPGHWEKSSGNILVYFLKSGNKTAPKLYYGQVLIASNKSIPIPGAAWPDGFDFSNVMRYRNIYHQLFLNNGQFITTSKINPSLTYSSLNFRDKLNHILEAGFEKKEIYGMLQSLVFGYKENIEPEDYQAFVNTGTVHVLAVSGMQIAILFWLLGIVLLKPFEKNKPMFMILSFVLIFFFWSYALITGCSPSVVRATLMFSIVLAGRIISKKLNILNSVYASAFLLLVFNPYYLIDVGFQLSYLAVLGIVYIHPKISGIFSSRFWLIQKSWELLSVSMAAQIGTLPITLYFFKQFPSYFLLSNLVIIPLTNTLLVLCLIALAIKFIPFLWVIMKWVIVKLTHTLYALVHYFEHMPGALIKNIRIDEWQVLLILTLVLVFVLHLWQPSIKKRLAFVVLLTFWFAHSMYKNYNQKIQQMAFVAELKGHLVLEVCKGNQAVIFSDTNFINHHEKYDPLLKDHFQKHKIDNVQYLNFKKISETGYISILSNKMKSKIRVTPCKFGLPNEKGVNSIVLLENKADSSELCNHNCQFIMRNRFFRPEMMRYTSSLRILNNNYLSLY